MAVALSTAMGGSTHSYGAATLSRKLPLYRERGVTRATIFVGNYTIHLRGHDAAATQSLAIGSRIEIVGIVRRNGKRNLMYEIDGELVAD